MKELQEVRNEVLHLKNMGVINKQEEIKLLQKLNALEAAISVIHCCKSDSEQLLCKHCDNKKVLHSEATGLCPDRFKHFEAK